MLFIDLINTQIDSLENISVRTFAHKQFKTCSKYKKFRNHVIDKNANEVNLLYFKLMIFYNDSRDT